ncbi:MAG TPA: CvpA family protein [Planctomicrobium sp.]|nr:CvpA family protein [Planctomicrobium sp.]
MQSLTWFDIVVVGILIFFTMRGAVKGVIFQLASLAGIVLCFVFANGISEVAGPYVHLEPPLNNWVIFAVSYLGFTFICYMIARALHDWMEKAKLKDVDRHLGAVFGFLKGVVLSLVLTFVVVTMSVSARESLKNSYSGRYAAIIMDKLHPIMPKRLHDAVDEYIHLLDHDGLDLDAHQHGKTPIVDSPFGPPGTLPVFPVTNPTTNPPAPIPSNGSGWWNQLQGFFNTDSQRVVNDALQRADPQTRSQIEQSLHGLMQSLSPQEQATLQQQITQVGANQLKQFLDSRLGALGQPLPNNTPGATTPGNVNFAAQKLALASEIAAIYSPQQNVRQHIEQDIAYRTSGVPDAVVVAALNDWKADLQNRKPDPDPQTTAEFPVEIRLVRQLQISGIPLEQLSSQVQQRLRGGQAQGAGTGTGSPL